MKGTIYETRRRRTIRLAKKTALIIAVTIMSVIFWQLMPKIFDYH